MSGDSGALKQGHRESLKYDTVLFLSIKNYGHNFIHKNKR